jgi:hypothetical protein
MKKEEKKEEKKKEFIAFGLVGESGNFYELEGEIEEGDCIFDELVEQVKEGNFCPEYLRCDLILKYKGIIIDEIFEKIVAIKTN